MDATRLPPIAPDQPINSLNQLIEVRSEKVGSRETLHSTAPASAILIRPTLESINVDVLHLIAKCLTKGNLFELARTCKIIHTNLMPLIYASYTIEVVPSTIFDQFTEIVQLRDTRNPFKPAHFRHLKLQLPRDSKYRCVCPTSATTPSQEPHALQAAFQSISSLLRALPEGVLKSFTWDMGANRWAARSPLRDIFHQRDSLEYLTVYHSNELNSNSLNDGIPTLPQFHKLRYLSYNGIFSDYHIYTLRAFIYHHGAKLETLQLHFEPQGPSYKLLPRGHPPVYSYYHGGHRYTSQYVDSFSNLVLQITPLATPTLLTSLQELSLSHVTIKIGERDMVAALNLQNLRSLTLIECGGAIELLTLVTERNVDMKLKRFEFKHSFWRGRSKRRFPRHRLNVMGGAPDIQLGLFLQSFSGLEALYLKLDHPWMLLLSWICPLLQSLKYHSTTLKSLVMHNLEEYRPFEHDPTYNTIYTAPQLIYRGVEVSCDFMLDLLRRCEARPHWQVLHFRHQHHKQHGRDCPAGNPNSPWLPQVKNPSPLARRTATAYLGSGELGPVDTSFRQFAQFVFGKEGIPSLQILAHGDFSYNGRFLNENLLVCRCSKEEWGYRFLDRKDIEMWQLVEDSLDMLASCPWTHF